MRVSLECYQCHFCIHYTYCLRDKTSMVCCIHYDDKDTLRYKARIHLEAESKKSAKRMKEKWLLK